MRILLIDIDSTIPNLALKKIELYYQTQGAEIIWNNYLYINNVDKIFVSCVFDWNKIKCYDYEGIAEVGGSGYDLNSHLPEEIEKINPKINMGFATRGCIRNCYFCIVPRKEGKIKAVADINDIWDRKSKDIILLDNNILALPEHFFLIAKQLKENKLRVDFNQGLDHRILTEEICKELLSLRHIKEIRFAFDDIRYEKTVLRALDMLERNGLKEWGTRWYVYVSETDTFETVYERMELLRQHKQKVYVMRDREIYTRKDFMCLSCWGNTVGAFKEDFKEVMKKSKRLSVYRKYVPQNYL